MSGKRRVYRRAAAGDQRPAQCAWHRGGGFAAQLSFLLALLACVLVWLLIWHTPFAMRSAPWLHPHAALYAGINPKRLTLMVMCLLALY